jgi:hypothetical protein
MAGKNGETKKGFVCWSLGVDQGTRVSGVPGNGNGHKHLRRHSRGRSASDIGRRASNTGVMDTRLGGFSMGRQYLPGIVLD